MALDARDLDTAVFASGHRVGERRVTLTARELLVDGTRRQAALRLPLDRVAAVAVGGRHPGPSVVPSLAAAASIPAFGGYFSVLSTCHLAVVDAGGEFHRFDIPRGIVDELLAGLELVLLPVLAQRLARRLDGGATARLGGRMGGRDDSPYLVRATADGLVCGRQRFAWSTAWSAVGRRGVELGDGDAWLCLGCDTTNALVLPSLVAAMRPAAPATAA